MKAKQYEYVIAGAGLSGLTAAAYLTKKGYSVLVLEKTSSLGGLLNSFSHKGYLFDAGARAIENSGIIKPMLKDLGIEMELLESPVSIGIESEVVRFLSKESIDHYKELLKTLYPESVEDVGKVFKVIYNSRV